MYSTSTAYKTEIKKPSRSFECKITIGDRIYNNSDIVNVVIDGNIQPSDGFMIGTTVSKTLDLTLINSGDTIYSTSQIKVEIGLKIGSTIEYIPMGLFNIDDIEKTDYTTKITAFDNMIKFESAYFSSLGDNPTLQQVVNELAAKTGVQFTGSLPTYTVKKLEGFTCREIVGYVASICGGNAVITRDGKFTIVTPTDVSLSIVGSNYINYKREEVKYKVGKVTCKVGEEELSKGSLGTNSMELGFENPWITNNILQDIYTKLNGFNYLGYSMKWQGDLSLDVGDVITITDVKGVVRKHPVLAQKFNYTGGLTAEIGAKGENKNKNSFSSSGDTSKKLNRMVTEVAIINKAFIDYAHINDADIVNLKAETAKIRLVEADVATINTVLAGTVNAVNINADNINAATGRIAILESGSATISQLNAANAKIATLESRAGVIDTLLAGNLTADNMKANLITAGTTLIADGSIASAKIISLSADKINAGKINTNLVSIQSSSGNMLISDNTIQIKDNTRVRVQIGKDESNDYNMYVWDSSGNLMFDATGLKASGIKAKIIRDDMVSDTANINATKIEKESLVTRINGATTLLLASKVKLDTENQTLEVAFNSLKSTVTTTASTVTSQGTSISTIQGQIQAKIWQQDIDTLEDSLGTRISSTETSITALNSAISLKVSTSDFTTYQGTVTNSLNSKANQSALNTTNGNVSSLTTRVSTAESSISVLQNQISLKVEQADITTAINNVSIGIRNLLQDSSFELGTIVTESVNSGSRSVVTETSYVGSKSLKVISSVSSNASGVSIRCSNLTIGQKYTVSLWVKCTTDDALNLAIYNISNWNSVTSNVRTSFVSNTWTKVNISFIAGETSHRICLLNGTAKSITFYVDAVKVETGDKITDWIPANEDVASYTDKQIATAKAEIKLTTDSISSTVSSVQSSVTSLGTRVTSAESNITSLNNSITLKVNTSDFNSYKTSNDSAVSSKASQVALNTTNGNVTALTTRVSTAESSISVLQGQIVSKVTQIEIDNSINAVQIGGRNLWINSKTSGYSAIESLGNNHITGQTGCYRINNGTSMIFDIEPDYSNRLYRKITFSAWVKYSNVVQGTNTWNVFNVFKHAVSMKNSSTGSTTGTSYLTLGTYVGTSDWKKVTFTYDYSANKDYDSLKTSLRFNVEGALSGTAWVTGIKVEIGDKVTDWSPALEDTQNQIDGAVTRISTAESTITQLSNSIALKVETSTYNTKMSSLDGSINSLTNRVSAAELKITDSSIVSTVRSSTAYTSDLAAKANQSALNTTNSNVSSLTTRVTNTESSITQLSNSITLKVNQSDFGTLITQNISSIKIAVGQIGGTNLLRDSSFELGYSTVTLTSGPVSTWSIVSDAHGVLPNNSKKMLYMNCFGRFGDAYVDTNMTMNIRVGQTYIVSYDYVCAGAVSGQSSYMWIGSNAVALWSSSYIADQKWHRMVVKYTATTDTTMKLRFGFIASEAWLAIDNVKIEEGDNATAYSPNPNEASNISVDVSDAGLTVRNGAISILNKAGTQVLSGDTSGNLTIRGDFTTYDDSTGNMAMRLSKRTMYFYDYDSNAVCGEVFAGKIVDNGSQRGMVFGAWRNKFLQLSYQGTDNNMYGVLTVDNGALGSTGTISITSGKQISTQNLYVSGSKNCIQDTQNYGKRLLYAYETTESYLGDLGFGKINEYGECVISTDEIFGECINVNIEYHVFTQVYQGVIRRIQRYANYFIVKGEIGTEFSWELKAKRAGFEHVRLEQKFVEEYGVESIEDELKSLVSSDIDEELYGDLANELLEV
ncbi:hypothetical protein [Clostridium sp. UBA1652]|uniref:hypothetical protein n=1 Tax=Clostridium sp. UBA1652 TaxID=1946348 RepID=UPI00257FD9C6|nr:hypothetical protein [Clostridium sp. UBA1652]